MKEIHTNVSQRTLKIRKEYRARIELLRNRLGLLSGEDRLLMTMYLERENSFRQIARLAGVSDTVIARRINKLTKRLLDGEYISCLRNHNKFGKTDMSIAKDYFLMGLSIKKIAAKRHLTYYRARETIKKIRQTLTTMQPDSVQDTNQAEQASARFN